MIKLIINADDFGHSQIFNEEILKLLDGRLITSTTVMVNRVDSRQDSQIKALGKLGRLDIGVGLHCELGGSGDLLPQLKDQHGKFLSLFGFGPSHLDVHLPKYQTNSDFISAVIKYAEDQSIPVRNIEGFPATARRTDFPCFSATSAGEKATLEYIKEMKDGFSYEILVHPGRYDPESKSSLNEARYKDVETMERISQYLKTRTDIKLISYKEL